MHINVGCGPFRAPYPWVNIDVIHIDNHIEPDVVVHSMWPEFWDMAGFTKVYLGHVLEHIQWERVPDFMHQLLDKCEVGAEICVVGPDILKFLSLWKDDQMEWSDVAGAIEHHLSFQSAGTWDGARHQWNCYEERLLEVLTFSGLEYAHPVPVVEGQLKDWPVTSFVNTQCCVIGTKLT